MADDFSGFSAGPSAFDWITGFGQSAVESIPELVGITPSTETQHWRQDNPVGGFISELAGMAVPYAGWLKATQQVKRFDKAVKAIGDIQKSPILSGALQEGARLLPFEAGRLGASQVIGDKPFDEMLGETALNLALGSGVGGLLHGLAAAGTRNPSLKTIFGPDLDLAAPLPLQARQMKELIAKGTLQGDDLGRANAKLQETLRQARLEELPASHKYIGAIAHDSLPGANVGDLEKQLNRLFRVRNLPEDRILQTRRFATGVERDFVSDAAWRAEAQRAGLPEGFEEHGQFFRHISFNKEAGEKAANQALTIDSKLTKNMQSVGNGTWITQEADDGLFVIAKKISGEAGTGTPDDKWVLFKTDKPGLFVQDAEKWAKAQIAQAKWVPNANLAEDGGDVYNTLKGYTQLFPLRNYMAIARRPEGVGKVVDALIPKGFRGADNELVKRTGDAIKEYLAPRIFQFKKSWRANWIANATKISYDQAETMTQELLNGTIKTDPGKSLFYQGLTNAKQGLEGLRPVRETVEALSPDDMKAFWQHVWRPGKAADELEPLVQAGTISPEVRDFAKNLELVDKRVRTSINKVEEATGHSPTEWKAGHYGLSRVWEGDTRIILTNDAGQPVAIASGPNRKMAQANAEKMLAQNPEWKLGNEFSLSQFGAAKDAKAFPEGLQPVVKAPSWLLERQDMRGFKWDTEAFTKEEFLEAYEAGLRSRNNYQANLAVDDVLQPQLHALMREDPAAFRQVVARMNDFAGVQGKLGRLQNQMVDAVLAPVLGTNSATKIVGVTNTALYNLQLGALKLSYPLVNALQFVQTVLPEAAFVMGKALDDRLAEKYSFFAAGGTKGPVGGVAALSPLKLMYSSMKEMAKPSKELSEAFQRAVNDRVIDPRIVESYIGESAVAVRDLRKAVSSGKDFVEWVRGVSEFLPATTERLSRTHAFTVGYGLARDFLRTKKGEALSADQMYNFARQFTENTMFLYSAADKPRIFTSPAGNLMGLFKNWMMHYMGMMGEYTAEGFMRNNWAPLAWQTAGTFGLGGLSATPLMWAADGFSRMALDKSILQAAYDEFGSGADGVMLGLPAALTGISLYSQVNSPLSNPARDASSMFSMVAWDRMKYVGKAVGAAMDHWQATGEHPAASQGVRELLARAFAPTTVYRGMAAANDGYIKSLNTGYPLAKDVPAAHRLLYAFGFNPTELDKGSAVASEIYQSQQKHKEQVASLGKAWMEAQAAGDSRALALIMRQAMVWGVDVSSVIRSGMVRTKNAQMDQVERKIRPQDIAPYSSVLARE